METVGVDRLAALQHGDRARAPRRHDVARRRLRRHERSAADAALFDKQIQLRMGQANVSAGSTTSCRWSTTTTPRGRGLRHPPPPPRRRPPTAYEIFQKKQDDAVKVIFTPGAD